MELLWRPSLDRIERSQLKQYMNFVGRREDSYGDLHHYSVNAPSEFWNSIIDYFKVKYSGKKEPALESVNFKEYTWYKNIKLNFAENLLTKGDDHSIALNFVHESGKSKKMTYRDLRSQVAKLSHYLKDFIVEGDVLGAYMPNIPETVISMLATSSLGGIFTSTSSDFGVNGVVDRFSQSQPKVIVAAIGYEYFGKYFDLTDRIIEIENKLEGVTKIILVDFLGRGVDLSRFKNAELFSSIIEDSVEHELVFKSLPFSHPLYIMYSSGTTGKPKCIVHSQGGTLINHIKELGLHTDLTEDKKIFFFTTCGWMMWNWLVSSLYFGAEVVLYEGSPAHPNPEYYFNIINREGINIFGTSPKFLKALEDSKAKFPSGFKTLETILSTGSPLLPEQYDYVYHSIKEDVLLASISGGTDIIGCFMLGNPILPVYKGEIQCIGLGMNVMALNELGESTVNQEGELVCASTFPSRPLYFLNDQNNIKMDEAYFNQNKNMWTHGDYIKITERKGVIVYGRSDATLNPGGVRIGTAEIYRQTETLHYLEDAICVGKSADGDVDVILFVKMKAGEELTIERKKQIKDAIRKHTTPRHVPREIHAVEDIPYTRSGKKVELAVTRILQKREVTNREALINPESLDLFKQFV